MHLPISQILLNPLLKKLAQESMAYMGCASVHVSQLVKELTDAQREEVPVDENLIKVFNDWEN